MRLGTAGAFVRTLDRLHAWTVRFRIERFRDAQRHRTAPGTARTAVGADRVRHQTRPGDSKWPNDRTERGGTDPRGRIGLVVRTGKPCSPIGLFRHNRKAVAGGRDETHVARRSGWWRRGGYCEGGRSVGLSSGSRLQPRLQHAVRRPASECFRCQSSARDNFEQRDPLRRESLRREPPQHESPRCESLRRESLRGKSIRAGSGGATWSEDVRVGDHRIHLRRDLAVPVLFVFRTGSVVDNRDCVRAPRVGPDQPQSGPALRQRTGHRVAHHRLSGSSGVIGLLCLDFRHRAGDASGDASWLPQRDAVRPQSVRRGPRREWQWFGDRTR